MTMNKQELVEYLVNNKEKISDYPGKAADDILGELPTQLITNLDHVTCNYTCTKGVYTIRTDSHGILDGGYMTIPTTSCADFYYSYNIKNVEKNDTKFHIGYILNGIFREIHKFTVNSGACFSAGFPVINNHDTLFRKGDCYSLEVRCGTNNYNYELEYGLDFSTK